MIEIPEAFVIANQIDETLASKKVEKVEVPAKPNKYSFYFGNPSEYWRLLNGAVFSSARALGGMVEISFESRRLVLSDGAVITFHDKDGTPESKSQLTITFGDGTSLTVRIQLYGGIWCFNEGEFNNKYYLAAQEKPSPLVDQFNEAYFLRILDFAGAGKHSLKSFLATEQRIPGLGNGTLQDIAWTSGLHPKIKIESLSDEERGRLFSSIRSVMKKMAMRGGRDSEKDFFGNRGGYTTIMGKGTYGKPCPRCGALIERQDYLGGKIYFCSGCQKK
ncbi:MAG: hypothetical protein JW697_08440 [Kosmotogaceae bacterium]|nr:hypothetical protein [Kosmotogaceae bacterium]